MWMGMIGFNVLCLAAAAFALRRLLRPAPVEDAGGSFAQVLAAAAPLARRLMNRGNLSALEEPSATAAACVEPTPLPLLGPSLAEAEKLASDLPVLERLAIVRRMLQGASVEEAAAATGVSRDVVRALYGLHGRRKAGIC